MSGGSKKRIEWCAKLLRCFRSAVSCAGRHASAPVPVSAVADWAEQAAGLLSGGVPAQRIPEKLGTEQFLGGSKALVNRWAVVCAVWRIAERTGSPRGPALQHVAQALRELERLDERRRVLLAGTRSTVALVCGLPAVAWFLGWVLGFDPLHQFTTWWGVLISALGMGLLWGGVNWLRRMAARIEAGDSVVGLEFVLLCAGLGGVAGVPAATQHVVAVVGALPLVWCDLGEFASAGAVTRAVSLARENGAPVRQILLSAAEESRCRAHAQLEMAAERLAVRALLPLGLCVLPAFVLLGVVPLVLGVLNGMEW